MSTVTDPPTLSDVIGTLDAEPLPVDVAAFGLSLSLPDYLDENALGKASVADLLVYATGQERDDAAMCVLGMALDDLAMLDSIAMASTPQGKALRRLSARLAVVHELHTRQIETLRDALKASDARARAQVPA